MRSIFIRNQDSILVTRRDRYEIFTNIGDGQTSLVSETSPLYHQAMDFFQAGSTEKEWLENQKISDPSQAKKIFNKLRQAGCLCELNSSPLGTNIDELDSLLENTLLECVSLRKALIVLKDNMNVKEHLSHHISAIKLAHYFLVQLGKDAELEISKNISNYLKQIKQTDLKLHLGCGSHHFDGWENIDLGYGDISFDLTKGLPYDDNSVKAIYMGHIFEHLEYKDESSSLLLECHRVLKPGGRIRIVVPDIEAFLNAYVHHDEMFFNHFQKAWARPPFSSHLDLFLHYAGAGSFPHVIDQHKFGYDFVTLSKLLTDCLFTHIVRCTPQQGSFVNEIDHSWPVYLNNGNFSLIVEATVAKK
ncbi:class I SAM-dependent methyltransferase [Vibrio mediterranei]|uniref:class I SAM-dependent methyltransferase n=1 Tax=Vibrio mediterranei TaxID=689 RepID=UPI00148DC90F|nr:methyltransferase domain-containing protein [Vibrio mediterranei]NOH31507.1 methyltransferase domain-containing protein [Vibrio mediterranei]